MYKRIAVGDRVMFQERNKTRVSCKECKGGGGGVMESSLHHRMDITHGIVLPHIRGYMLVDGYWIYTVCPFREY